MRKALASMGLVAAWSCAAHEPATVGQDAGPVGDAGDGGLDRGVCARDAQVCDGADAGENGHADAEVAAAPVCAQTLAVGCIPNPPFLWGGHGTSVDFSKCPPTWNDAIAFCVTHSGDFGYAQADCGTYLRWHLENVDVGCSYYYDTTSGDLVAVFCADFTGQTTCLGGPPGFVEPTCPAFQLQDYRPCVASDARPDGGDASTD